MTPEQRDRLEAWIDKHLADRPPLSAEECAAIARILDRSRIARAEAELAKRRAEK